MSKIVTIKLKRSGLRPGTFSIKDNFGVSLGDNISKDKLINGLSVEVSDSSSVITITQVGKNCCNKIINIPIVEKTREEITKIKFSEINKASLWRHLTDDALFNSFYGCIHPYILEYPFAYGFNDEIIQDVKDYSKVYTYLPSVHHTSDYNRRIQEDNGYFNKSILYNDQQSTGVLELVQKPSRNMKAYMTYPKFKKESKEIIYTKSDNFYQFNTFWNIVKDKSLPLFNSTCESLSIDKEVNTSNMEYTPRSFRKDLIRGKDSKLRMILDNRSDIHIISQVVTEASQISYK